MANAKHGVEVVTIHEQLPQDNLCSDDGIPAQECEVACGSLQWPMATPSVNGDQLAPRFAGYRDVSAADSRASLSLQQQLTAERARKLLPSAQAQHQQLGAAAAGAQAGPTAVASIGTTPNGSSWQPQRMPTLETASAVAPSMQPTAAALAAVAAMPTGAAYPLLQQRSPSSSWLAAVDSAAVASAAAAAAAATSVVGVVPMERSSESTVLHQLLNRVRELEEADRRNASREDAYRLQVQNLQSRVDDLLADRKSLLAENEQLKNALGAAASAARSMAVAAASQQQQQDPDSGFPTSSSSSAADRRSSNLDDTYKRRIADLQQQLELYQDEIQKQYDDNRILTEEKKLLQRRLSALGSTGVAGSAAAASSQPAQAGLDSGVVSSVHGQPTSSSNVSSSQELSVDAVRAIMQKVQKSREAVDELKDVVRRQTDIIKSYKMVIEKTFKQQGDTTSGGGGVVSARAALPARGTPTNAIAQHWDGGSARQQQLLTQKTAVSARGSAGSGLVATAAGATALSPALFSFAFPASQPTGSVGALVAAAAGSAAAQPSPSLPPAVPAASSREAVEQSDLSRSLVVCAASATASGSSWHKDDELSVGSARTMLRCSSLNESGGNDSLLSEIASTIAVAGLRGDAKLLSQQSLRPPTPGGMVLPAPASDYDVLPMPSDLAATDAVMAVPSASDYRVCPVCNARFSSQTPLDRLQEHILDCEGTSAPLPVLQQQSPSPPCGSGGAAAVATETPSAGSSGERTCPMCCAHFPPELPQREYELHVMAHFDDDGFVVAGREPLPPGAL